jgi:hypothetical protein
VVSDYHQLGRSVMLHLARRAVLQMLVKGVARSVIDRKCPLAIAASGPYVARYGSDPSLVSYRRAIGYRRLPGNLASRATRSIGECRMSLWSAMVVSIQAHGSGVGWRSWPPTGKQTTRLGRWSA